MLFCLLRLAATLHAKIDKKKLHKLDIIHIWYCFYSEVCVILIEIWVEVLLIFCSVYCVCGARVRSEQILNPAVPMGLRLSGILMGKLNC